MLEKKMIIRCILNLYWEFDRMSDTGKESLETLAKIFNVPTEAELKNRGKNEV